METRKNEQEKTNNAKHSSALEAASLGRSSTSQVDPHNNSSLANTGTNISYEGATAPGAGGAVGTGYASGKEATGETMVTNSDYEQSRAGKVTNVKKEDDDDDMEEDDDLTDEDDLENLDDLDDEDYEDEDDLDEEDK